MLMFLVLGPDVAKHAKFTDAVLSAPAWRIGFRICAEHRFYTCKSSVNQELSVAERQHPVMKATTESFLIVAKERAALSPHVSFAGTSPDEAGVSGVRLKHARAQCFSC